MKSHVGRPLSADDICHVLAVELGSTDFNVRSIPLMSISVNSCHGIIDGIIIPIVGHCIRSRENTGKGKRWHVWRNTQVWTGQHSRARTDL